MDHFFLGGNFGIQIVDMNCLFTIVYPFTPNCIQPMFRCQKTMKIHISLGRIPGCIHLVASSFWLVISMMNNCRHPYVHNVVPCFKVMNFFFFWLVLPDFLGRKTRAVCWFNQNFGSFSCCASILMLCLLKPLFFVG